MTSRLAIDGGAPVRSTMLPYGRQTIGPEDIEAVVQVLQSDMLTTGPAVDAFERAFADVVGSADVIAVSNGTAALHAAMFALGIGPGDEVIVPSMTFAASANCVLYQGGRPVFADVEADTLLIDVADLERHISSRTRAIVAVDYAGQPCDYAALRQIADRHGLRIVADAAHSLGGSDRGRPVGTLADLTTFSLHPVKHITTAEGGMVATNDPQLAARLRTFRNHGITKDHRQREATNSWYYEIASLGYNYRLSDLQCALGCSQLRRLPQWLARRREIASAYDGAFATVPEIVPLRAREEATNAYHLYVVRVDFGRLTTDRAGFFSAMRKEGIGVNVHYIPVHLHPLYRQQFGTGPGLCPRAEVAYEEILSLPMFPGMIGRDVEDVLSALAKLLDAYRVA